MPWRAGAILQPTSLAVSAKGVATLPSREAGFARFGVAGVRRRTHALATRRQGVGTTAGVLAVCVCVCGKTRRGLFTNRSVWSESISDALSRL